MEKEKILSHYYLIEFKKICGVKVFECKLFEYRQQGGKIAEYSKEYDYYYSIDDDLTNEQIFQEAEFCARIKKDFVFCGYVKELPIDNSKEIFELDE